MIPQEGLTIKYMRLDDASKLRWRKNPKLHDIGAIVESIRRYGFVDTPGFDETLGAFTYGNGRDEALEWMHDQGDPLPRGVLLDDDGMWLMPYTSGVNQATPEQAEALAIDHNNLTMAGGSFAPYQIAEMWSADYTDVLSSLALSSSLPITVDGDALDGLLNREGNQILNAGELWRGMPEFEQDDLESWKAIKVHFANEEDYKAFAGLVGQTLTAQTRSLWYPPRKPDSYIVNACDDEP